MLSGAEAERFRKVRFTLEGAWLDVPVYDRAVLGVGATVLGPALIEERDTTIVLRPEDYPPPLYDRPAGRAVPPAVTE